MVFQLCNVHMFVYMIVQLHLNGALLNAQILDTLSSTLWRR